MAKLSVLLAQQNDPSTVDNWSSSMHNMIFMGVFVVVCIAAFIWWLKRNA